VWGQVVRPSQFPLLKGSPSRRPRPRGRACPRVLGAPGRLTGIPPVWGPGAVPVGAGGGRPGSWGARRGQGGMRCHRAGDTGACQGGACVAEVGHTRRSRRGGRRVWGPPPPPPPGAAVSRAPLEATGRPCQCTGGRCGRGGPHKASQEGGGRRVWRRHPGPLSRLLSRAPRWGGFTQGGRGATPRGATGRPSECTGAQKNGAGGADGGGRGGRRLPAATVPPLPPSN